mmetsp:Transcript_15706/g.16450  ORF Transcript_15706/g.16450 Transcript_15706/m.16450 type:complete len:256 (+) Transcript_15706:45-812(+)|eukprot:CAMPEP_0174821596 /NCGR_PEP_ID=MMETSP1107-20130205/9102_1 /TAXON_ID=36770 /ORGANISM="Paraphysomonas vestita, Strain GFlagA" /LENGTH=255 /DNA_ID=CAMNT_0016038815 /DNA_START=20 /DNA_END=787 /DNA_ORIENTATION=+
MSHGDGRNVPSQITQRLGQSIAGHVIYWSVADENAPIACVSCLEMSSMLAYMPCFWPHLIIMSPFFLGMSFAAKRELAGSYAVLTDSTLYILTENGSTVSIQLEAIVSIKATTKSESCGCCAPEMTRVIIDDGTVVYGKHNRPHQRPKTICGHPNIEEFARLILEAKERKAQVMTAQPQYPMQQGVPYAPGAVYPVGYNPNGQVISSQPVAYGQPIPQPNAPSYQMVAVNPTPHELEYPNPNSDPNAYPNQHPKK